MLLIKLFARQQWRHRHREGLVDTVGKGEGGRKGKGSMETYTLPYAKQTASGKVLYESGSAASVLCDQLDGMRREAGGRFEREGTYVHLWLTPVRLWQKLMQYCKAIIL